MDSTTIHGKIANSAPGAGDRIGQFFTYGTSSMSPMILALPLRTFLFGFPISYSLAPLLHTALFRGIGANWTYTLLESQDASQFLPALRQQDVIGCAVTMPYKVAAMSFVDEVTEAGRMVGAINTVFVREDKEQKKRYIGTNTDCLGVRDAFLQNVPGVLARSAGQAGLVIGGGGACRAAVYALWRWMGVRKIYLVNRFESEVTSIIDSFAHGSEGGFDSELVWVSSIEYAQSLETPVLIVGTVPDIPPREKNEVLVRKIVTSFLDREDKGCVLEMCYHPKPRTEFFRICKNAGWTVIPGTEAMIYQGVAQQMLWAEKPLEEFQLGEAKEVVRRKINEHV